MKVRGWPPADLLNRSALCFCSIERPDPERREALPLGAVTGKYRTA
jgi:hypothetical protein